MFKTFSLAVIALLAAFPSHAATQTVVVYCVRNDSETTDCAGPVAKQVEGHLKRLMEDKFKAETVEAGYFLNIAGAKGVPLDLFMILARAALKPPINYVVTFNPTDMVRAAGAGASAKARISGAIVDVRTDTQTPYMAEALVEVDRKCVQGKACEDPSSFGPKMEASVTRSLGAAMKTAGM